MTLNTLRVCILTFLTCVGAPALAASTETYTPTISPSPSPTPTVSPTAVCDGTFGCVTCTPEAYSGTLTVTELNASRFFLSEHGSVNGVYAFLSRTTGSLVRVGLYTDVSNTPRILLTQSLAQTTEEGWNFLPVDLVHLTAGNYWIAVFSEPGRLYAMRTSSGQKYSLLEGVPFGEMPNPHPASITGSGLFYLFYASYCPGPPIFFTPTPTPTPTNTPIQFKVSSAGRPAFGPVPVNRGTSVCLYFEQTPSATDLEVYNVTGDRVARARFELGEQACWDTSAVAPGIYIARAKVKYVAGKEETVMQKVVVLP